jgi:hypothetical protein
MGAVVLLYYYHSFHYFKLVIDLICKITYVKC